MTISKNILRLPKVEVKSGLKRSTIYLKISQGTFPKPINLGDRAVGWLEADIDEWIESRVKSPLKTMGTKYEK